ncbi:MAG: TonB-dependent receptor [Saprospiraceae bacterium]|nr:TonB-dependent receptor [Saprospiraceae bacterium]
MQEQQHHIIKTEQKALDLNLDPMVYGTFAEIGAGQEVARNFFQVGAAAGTIAKTMSAYDKGFSDAIYGKEESGRYVCEPRLYKMLDHEYRLMDERLGEMCHMATFFVFADTVSAINYARTIKGNGWLGVRFQHAPCSEPNDLAIHVKMLDNDNKLQQEAIGVLGVNLIYSCFRYRDNPELMVKSLMDGLEGRVSVDFIKASGPAFEDVENRLLALYLVKHGLTEVTMFDEHKQSIHASEFLYRKALMVVRGNFRPPTLVTQDVVKSSFEQFKNEDFVDEEKAYNITEITLDYLTDSNGVIDDKDFLDRTELICALGYKVLVSNCSNHQKLINYLADYKIKNLGLVIGVRELLEIINNKYYNNQDGRLLVAFGELFTRNIKIYTYPALQDDGETIMNTSNLPVPEGIKFLYKHLTDSHQIVDIEDYESEMLYIDPTIVYNNISKGNDGWQNKVPEELVDIILEKQLFKN